VVADIRAPDEATLDAYCDRVASAVGRLSVRVFGMEEQEGLALAHQLGRALQLTNILRDLDEDAVIGRLYLPGPVLQAAGISSEDPKVVLASPDLGKACGTIVERACKHFAQADAILTRNPRRTVRAPRIMAEAYRMILDSLVERGWSSPRRPIHIPRARLLWIIMRHAFV
jgi:presqualene diphosphate synthase